MPISQQKLNEVKIKDLRNLRDLDITFDYDKSPVTGIFGVNGCGKTTLLYVLLCLYCKISEQNVQYNFGSFFKRCNEHEFDNTQIEAIVSFRDGENIYRDKKYIYRKSSLSDRWTPRTSGRPKRDVYFFGISSCVPRIEEDLQSSQNYTFNIDRDVDSTIVTAASRILGIDYRSISKEIRVKKKYYHAIKTDGTNYYSVSMGAGEQRVIRLLELLSGISNYSLVVIDEIDLTLHTAALNKLISYLIEVGNTKHIQFVFTSHRESITNRKDINVRHLFQTSTHTLCFNNTTPECYDSMTGRTSRPLEIYVEDDLAEQIISAIAEEIGIKSRVQIHKYGSCENAFVVSSALKLMGKPMSDKLFVLDGDIYRTDEERLSQIKKHFTGNESGSDEARNDILRSIKSFNLQENKQPEQYINEIIRQRILGSNEEIVSAAENVIAPHDKHDYLNKIIEKLGDSHEVGLYKLIKELQKHTNQWNSYVSSIHDWLLEKKTEHNL